MENYSLKIYNIINYSTSMCFCCLCVSLLYKFILWNIFYDSLPQICECDSHREIFYRKYIILYLFNKKLKKKDVIQYENI